MQAASSSQPANGTSAALIRQQETLRAVIEAISSELELRPLLTAIVRYACELLTAERGTIGLVDPQKNVVRTEAAFNMPLDELGAEMAPGVGLAGQVLLTHQPVVFDAYGDLDNPMRDDLMRDAVVGVPIPWRGEMIGFFGLGAQPPRRFSEQDVEVLTVFARHAAIAIENARLFEAEKRRSARITAINRIGHLIASSLSLDQTLENALGALSSHLAFSNIALLLVDPAASDTLELSASAGMYARDDLKGYRQSVDDGIIGYAARTRQRVLIEDVRVDSRYIPVPDAPTIRSELATPIVVGDRLLGVLNIESEEGITADDGEGVQVVADQLGVAIENARLFAATERALDERQLLYETSRAISVAMDVDQVIEAYLSSVAAGARYRCSVVLYDFDTQGNRKHVIVRGRWSPEEGILAGIEIKHPYMRDTLDDALDQGETITISDVFTDPRAAPELREIQRRDKRPALAMIPLIVRRQRIGLVILSYTRRHEWTDTELRSYQVTAAQLAAAIDSREQQILLFQRGQQIAVISERQRLARELHDSVTQLIFSITLIAQSLSAAWRRSAEEGESRINRLLELSQTAQVEMRSLLAELRASEFDASDLPMATLDISRVRRDGLAAALKDYAASQTNEGLSIEVDTYQYSVQEHSARLQACEEALYRIAQEALSNAIRHSEAQHIEIRIGVARNHLFMIVSDDGQGFSLEDAEAQRTASSGLGLNTMRERATALGGTLEMIAAPGEGTTIHVRLPQEE